MNQPQSTISWGKQEGLVALSWAGLRRLGSRLPQSHDGSPTAGWLPRMSEPDGSTGTGFISHPFSGFQITLKHLVGHHIQQVVYFHTSLSAQHGGCGGAGGVTAQGRWLPACTGLRLRHPAPLLQQDRTSGWRGGQKRASCWRPSMKLIWCAV
ncbi:hypothetical protein J4Q44_G00214010 [Coregonus suidteri]|uniref:Uncharacterized protein n=1 Tax=Coregonus suidteri TaxID=861788 RepID=A0AAN8LD57_9TELE